MRLTSLLVGLLKRTQLFESFYSEAHYSFKIKQQFVELNMITMLNFQSAPGIPVKLMKADTSVRFCFIQNDLRDAWFSYLVSKQICNVNLNCKHRPIKFFVFYCVIKVAAIHVKLFWHSALPSQVDSSGH